MIAFIGSVFSPYYAWSQWRDPFDHCAVNVALYGASGHRWTMTERGGASLHRARSVLAIGPSQLCWDDGALTLRLDEITAPAPSRIRGTIRLRPSSVLAETFALDPQGRHRWRPIAPRARVEVALSKPFCAWAGDGYFDSNAGEAPLESAFIAWNWSRTHRTRDTLIFYDVERRGGDQANLAMRVDPQGRIHTVEAPPRVDLPRTLWRMPRAIRADPHQPPKLNSTLEDAPFYSRSGLVGGYGDETAQTVHESLSLDRLRSPVVRAMLPFRMPRAVLRG